MNATREALPTDAATRYNRALLQALADLPQSLSLAWDIAWRDFQSRYVGTWAGCFWAVLSPLLYSGIFVAVRQLIHDRGLALETDGVHPAVFAFFGVAVYQVWFDSVLNQVNYLRRASSLLTSLRIQPEAFFLSQLLLSWLDLAVRIGIITLAMALFLVEPGPHAWAAPLLLVMTVLTGNVIGYVLAFPGSFYQDVAKMLQSISLGILLISPIFYPAATDPDSLMYRVQLFNPLACTLSAARSAAFGVDVVLLWPALMWTGGLLIVFVLLLGVYRVTTPFVMERL